MSVNTENVKAQIQTKATSAPQQTSQQDPGKTLNGLLKSMQGEIQRALPKHMNADRLARIALTEVRRNPKLLECDQLTFIGALMQCAQLGLEPGPLGHAYLIPYWESKTRSFVVQFQIGYQGLIDLMRRSGQIAVVIANEVRENDVFEYSFGSNGGLVHKPLLKGSRGEVVAYYAYARTVEGGESYYVASVDDMMQFREKYAKKNKEGHFTGPWITEFDAMARKTCIKQMAKYMPKSIEIAQALAMDETTKTTIEPEMAYAIDIHGQEVVDTTTGEILPTQESEPETN